MITSASLPAPAETVKDAVKMDVPLHQEKPFSFPIPQWIIVLSMTEHQPENAPPRILPQLITLFIFLFHAQYACAVGIELHAHLFMKQGMTWLFRGHFEDQLQARDWGSRLSSQANPQALNQSQLDLIVATLYAHPLLTRSLPESIKNQIRELKSFLKKNPNWVLVKTPAEAKSALHQGKKLILLALEGGSGILESDANLQEWIDQEGIRIVTPLHLTDDHWGGVAFLKGFRVLASPWAFLQSLLQPHFESLEDGSQIRLNKNGLTSHGRTQIQKLLGHHVWIDFTHASDASQVEIRTLLPSLNYPLLYTHTVLRRFHHAERGISEQQLKAVAETRGYLGLIPSEELLEDAPPLFSDPQCQGGVFAFAEHYRRVTSILGESFVATGSDYNGGVTHLQPVQGCTHTQTLLNQDERGFWEIGQSRELWKALQELGMWHPIESPVERDHSHVHAFLETWERAWKEMDALSLTTAMP